jgi:alcohol dehydrogenase class IV
MNINNFFNTVEQKRFYTPTHVFLGKGTKDVIYSILHKSMSAVLVIDSFFKEDDFVCQLFNYFDGSPYKIDVDSEPHETMINTHIGNIPKKYNCIIAIGGGSTIDTAKAILSKKIYGEYKKVGYGHLRDIPEVVGNERPLFITLPTTAGTGSETSRYFLISDEITKGKNVSRSWSFVADYALLDPYFLNRASKKLLCLCAFDAFVHLWETYVCRYESSWFGEMLSHEGITQVISAMQKLNERSELNEEVLLRLQYAALLGGIAIANTRTGIIHDAGESLSAQCTLSHPETLFIFFEEAIKQYREAIHRKEISLIDRIKSSSMISGNFNSLDDIFLFWNELFDIHGIDSGIQSVIKSNNINPDLIIANILEDQVLVNKESPEVLTPNRVKSFVTQSIQNFS